MQTFNQQKISRIKEILAASKKIVIVSHKSPDGDSVGSSVGLYHYLSKKNPEVTICHPDEAACFLKWMNGSEKIIHAENNYDLVVSKINEADTIFCVDFNSLSRIGLMTPILEKSTAVKVMIDHHLNPEVKQFDLIFSEPESCSTAQLIADLIIALGDQSFFDENIANALYCGIMTDSGSFRFSSVTAHTHEIVSILMKYGLTPYKIHEAVFDNNTFDRLKLHAYAINEKMEILEGGETALIYLSQAELKRFNYIKGDTEGLVNVGLSIAGIKRSVFLMEHDKIIKISFRSKGTDNPVNEVAKQYFNGGGHANAAGGSWKGTLEEAIKKIKSVFKIN